MNSTKYPRGIEVIAGAYIINEKMEVLLCRSPKRPTQWSICGGHIEAGELIKDAVLREVKEELGIEVEYVCLLLTDECFAEPPEFIRHAHFIFLDSVVKFTGGNFQLDSREISEIRWFEWDEAAQLPDLEPFCRKGINKLKVLYAIA